ncbi:unnamed protein product [Dovyalis caffra]|uniref:Methyltransferase type 11 domain-containing protein n=1 Tax=Dovyalis caffra TaxID=77055 RepID=A0AAV1R1I1_9ROSI|nr:unnamed protein product [Dovyalis caffra]
MADKGEDFGDNKDMIMVGGCDDVLHNPISAMSGSTESGPNKEETSQSVGPGKEILCRAKISYGNKKRTSQLLLRRNRRVTKEPCALIPSTSYCTHIDTNATDGQQSSKAKIFDRELKRKQRDRAAWLMRPNDPFVDAVAENLLDRLEDCKKKFPTALCLGGSLEAIRSSLRGRGSIEKLIMMDTSNDMVKSCKDAQAAQRDSDQKIETSFVVGDEEYLPIKESSVDLVISCLGLHWTNDLPGAMIQCKLALKPDGLFLAAILGGETLKELRIACTVAQMEREGGISPRISPLAQGMYIRRELEVNMIVLHAHIGIQPDFKESGSDVRDAGNLLTRAGFTLPGVDVDEYVVRYSSALELIEHLRTMGETNALLQRNNVLKRETALATAAIYDSMFAAEDGTIPATFQVIYMTGWREHPSQQKAKKRGSATISFDDIQKQFSSDLSAAVNQMIKRTSARLVPLSDNLKFVLQGKLICKGHKVACFLLLYDELLTKPDFMKLKIRTKLSPIRQQRTTSANLGRRILGYGRQRPQGEEEKPASASGGSNHGSLPNPYFSPFYLPKGTPFLDKTEG